MEIIRIENNDVNLNDEYGKKIAEIEIQIKNLKEQEEEMKKALLVEMEKRNIVKLENEYVIVTYVAPTDRETFDSKGFKEQHQDMYDEYVKMTPVKSSIRIKVKDE